MKRSMKIGLIVAGSLGVTSASGYYLKQRDDACRRNPRATDQDCQHSGHGSSGHGSGRSVFGTSSTSETSTPSSPSAQSSAAERGGFGSTGRVFGLLSGG